MLIKSTNSSITAVVSKTLEDTRTTMHGGYRVTFLISQYLYYLNCLRTVYSKQYIIALNDKLMDPDLDGFIDHDLDELVDI